jgi:hypothetical protein
VSLAVGASNAIDGVDALGAIAIEARRRSALTYGARLVLFATTPGRASNAAGSVAYAAFGGRLDLCPHRAPIARPLYFDACASLATWLVPVHAPDAAIDLGSLRALFAPGAVLRFDAELGAFRPGIELAGFAHLAREGFRIEPHGEVFRLPAAFGTLSFLGAWTIP